MKFRAYRHLAILTVATGLLGASDVRAGATEKAAQLAASGEALLANADFDGALKAYAKAAKTDAENQEYRQTYAVIRRVIKMRPGVDNEKNPVKWEQSVRALRAFYYEHGVFGEALTLDQKVYARMNTADTATQLAETQLAMGLNRDVAATIRGIDPAKTSPQARAYLGIALARQGELDEARAVAKGIQIPDAATPALYYDLACLHALIGDTAGALGMLTRCFENTPPSRLASFKNFARQDADLSKAVASADFATVLETESKVKESSCSGGTSCGSCPSRAHCGGGKSTKAPGHENHK